MFYQSSTNLLRRRSGHIYVLSFGNWERFTLFLYRIGNSKNEDSITAGGLVPRRFGEKKCRKAVYFSLVSPLDQNPNPKCKPYVLSREKFS